MISICSFRVFGVVINSFVIKQKAMKKLFDIIANRADRLIAPLVGFPGLKLVPGSIKLAQQNHLLHFQVLEALYKKFQPDLIFPMMDLSLEANALGRYAVFPQNEAATIPKQAFSKKDFELMQTIDITADARTRSYIDTVKMMAEKLPENVMKGAYVTGPFTLAALLKGADDTAMATSMDPEGLHELITFCNNVILKFMEELIGVGAQLICILEPFASLLSPAMLAEYSGKYVKNLAAFCAAKNAHSVLHICGYTMPLLSEMAATGIDALSLDSAEAGVELAKAAKVVPEDIVIIGNINPAGTILLGQPEEVEREVGDLLEKMKDIPNFILSTGCDLPQEVPLENIEAFMKAGRKSWVGHQEKLLKDVSTLISRQGNPVKRDCYKIS